MSKQLTVYTRLPLDGCVNARELGGYPTLDGDTIKHRRFLRTDELRDLSTRDILFLKDYGVKTVIDLRDDEEAWDRPDKYIDEPGVSYHQIPLFRGNAADAEWAERQEERTLLGMYMSAINNKSKLREVFQVIAHADEGCVLFHCAVGKDRTGIIACLLMLLAGCDRQDCVANYVQSRPNLMRGQWYRNRWNTTGEREHSFMDSADETITEIINFVYAAGGVWGFLRDCGVSEADLKAVKSRLLD